MLTKDQANTAADVLLEANKSTPPVRHAQQTLYDLTCRVIGLTTGLAAALVISQVFNVKFLMIGIIFTTTGAMLGSLIGNRLQKSKGA